MRTNTAWSLADHVNFGGPGFVLFGVASFLSPILIQDLRRPCEWAVWDTTKKILGWRHS